MSRFAYGMAVAVTAVVVSAVPAAFAQEQELPPLEKLQKAFERAKEGLNPSSTEGPPQLKEVARITGLDDWAVAVAFSPDGKQLAVGSYDEVRLYDSSSQELLKTLKTRKGYARSLAWTPDGTRLIVGEYQSISIWDTARGKRVKRLRGHRGYVTALVVSDDALVSGSLDGTVRRWNWGDGENSVIADFGDIPVQDVAASLDGTLLAVAIGDETAVTEPGPIVLLDPVAGEEQHRFEPHLKAALAVEFAGERLISGGEDEIILIHDVPGRQTIAKNSEHSRPINDFVVLQDGVTIASASGGRAVKKNEIFVWSSLDGEVSGMVEGHAKKITSLAISPDGRTLASGSVDKTVALWDLVPIVGPRPPVEAKRPDMP
ncbi:WD40 repeat domain-containing protein [Stratiformator vulcanicus]|uniref:WD domain, G-beta repeat n=1 Tax=Stratiformator vulcanicus TaxID=2527980 RepID=A0A517QY87_9PLAN|nr:WD40 repeat domain-containing protein [Stratiformator vulcanicus]QDT36520.1 WD domain, G-beta repeat [Stratiformator vulcanicus]